MKELSSAQMNRFDNFSAGLETGDRIGKQYLDSTVEAAMVIAGKNLYMNQPMDKYMCVACCLHKVDGTNQVLNFLIGTEQLASMKLVDFINEVVKPQKRKLSFYAVSVLKLSPDEIKSADIKIFTSDDLDTITAELKKMEAGNA